MKPKKEIMDLEEILEDCKMQTELMDSFEGKTFSEPKEIKIKKKLGKKKHLISVSEEFYQWLVVNLGKTKGVTWEYLLKRLLEKVEEKE